MTIGFVSNSSGQFGVSNFSVSLPGGGGNYTDINAAQQAASALSGKQTIYIYPGIYVGNYRWIGTNITYIGSGSGLATAGGEVLSIQFIGNQVIADGASVSFENITFSASSGNAFSNEGVCTLFFNNCQVSNSNGVAINLTASAPVIYASNMYTRSCYIFGSQGALSADHSAFTIIDTRLSSNNNTISLGQNIVASIENSAIQTNSQTLPALYINGGSSLVISRYNIYSSYESPCIFFSAPGTVQSTYDTFKSFATTGNYIDSSGSPNQGIVSYADSIMSGSAIGIGSNVIATLTPNSNSISSFRWNAVNSNVNPIVVNTGYIINGGAIILSLPPVSPVGAIFSVLLDGGISWTITQSVGQYVRIGSLKSTTTTGTVSSVSQGDAVNFVCTVANVAWTLYSGAQGALYIT